MAQIILKHDREKPLLRKHPWIYSGAVARISGSPALGEACEVITAQGVPLGWAAINQNSNILGRMWTWDAAEEVTDTLLEDRYVEALQYRDSIKGLINSNAVRLVYGESDGLPGLIVDQYDDVVVVQFLTAGIEYWKDNLIEIIKKNTDVTMIYERSDVDVRQLEGLPLVTGTLYGKKPEIPVVITDNGIQYIVDIVNGHKTGFYIDQRENRKLVKDIARDLRVLDCFCYTGGFSVNALAGQASEVTLVDSSKQALSLAKDNILLNNLKLDHVNFIEEDVFIYLRALRDRGDAFDLIILDPPKFAPTSAQVERATRGYKDINLLAFKLLRPGGSLLTFSCSGGVSENLFQKIVAGAGLDAGVDARIIKYLHQAEDHPVALNFPEAAYLKGFLIQKRS